MAITPDNYRPLFAPPKTQVEICPPFKPDRIDYEQTGWTTETPDSECVPVLARVECKNGTEITPYPLGYINKSGEFTVAATFTPGRVPDAEYDKEDLTPFKIVGPATAQDVTAIFNAALAASTVTTFSQEGSAITADDIAEAGVFNIATTNGHQGIVINGDTDNPFASWSDPDGVNMGNTFEVLDGCEALVTFCALKKFTPAK